MKRSRKKKKAVKDKSGKPYQRLVAHVTQSLEPDAIVTEGEWLKGPDGRLDIDVAIREKTNGTDTLGVIECKDFDPVTTGKVGRPYVDALDSKRQDLGASMVKISSNSGFTMDALRKAKRKSIGMISVLKRGDDIVRAKIEQKIYTPRIEFVPPLRMSFIDMDPAIDVSGGNWDSVRFVRKPVWAWAQNRAMLYAVDNPSITRRLAGTFRFKKPQIFTFLGKSFSASALQIEFEYQTKWFYQTVRLDANLGWYDHLRERVRLSPGGNQFVIDGVNFKNAKPCEPPEFAMRSLTRTPGDPKFLSGEQGFAIAMCSGLEPIPPSEFPDLDAFVVPKDLNTRPPVERLGQRVRRYLASLFPRLRQA